MINKEYKVIGTPVPKIDAYERVSGTTQYGHDICLPGMLHGAILRARYPAAEILSVDTSAAKKLDGVVCVITADDVDVNPMGYTRDHPVLKKGSVACIRDEIAAVAAVSKEIAEKALRLIDVKYKPLKGIFDPHEALNDTAPQINPLSHQTKPLYGKKTHRNLAESFYYEHGNLEEQRNKSACITTRRFTLPRVTHCCMATCNITADYSHVSGRLTLYSSTQVPFLYQRDMAHVLKMDPSQIRIIQPTIGGGFGSKLDMYPFEPICALLSIKTGKPVQILFSREEEFIASPTRQSMTIDVTCGADKSGKFTFRDVRIVKDNGAYTSWGATTSFVMMQTFSSLYRVPACRFEALAVYTNNPYAGSFRGYGNPQATFALERAIDLMAEELGMDRAEVRLINANIQGDTTGQGLTYRTCGLKEALETVVGKSDYGKNKLHLESQKGRYRRGIGFGSMLHVGGGAKIYRSDGCGTTVKIDPFGWLTIITGSNEIGQGSETVLAMIAAEELGIDLKKIKVINTDTDTKPWDVGVHASRTSFVAGNSLLGAIRKLKEKLATKAAFMLDDPSGEMKFENSMIISASSGKTIALDKVVRELHFHRPHELCIENYFYEPSSSFQDKEFKGNVSGTYAFASQAIEVEVDTYTGNVRVTDVWVAQDVGKVLNPLGLTGQIEGGVIMGMGYALSEELMVRDGMVLNPSFHDYRLLTASDVPGIHFYPVETNDPEGPYGAKGVGEAPLIPVAAAVVNAISNALGIEINELPATPERILKKLKEKKEKEKLIKINGNT